MTTSRLRLVWCVGALACLVIACTPVGNLNSSVTTSSPRYDPYHVSPDELFKYSSRWIEGPTLNLQSPEGTFVRAFIESMARISKGRGSGEAAIADAGYPGFLAVFEKYTVSVQQLDKSSLLVYGRGLRSAGYPIVGTNYYEPIKSTHHAGWYTVTICHYGSLTANDLQDGRFSSFGSDASKTSGLEILTFGPDPLLPPDRQIAPKADQHGPSNTPSDNVFGTWVLIKDDLVGTPADKAACTKLAPGTPTDWPAGSAVGPYIRTSPPPTLPPSPGWPTQ